MEYLAIKTWADVRLSIVQGYKYYKHANLSVGSFVQHFKYLLHIVTDRKQ